jgi:hypothetical protein
MKDLDLRASFAFKVCAIGLLSAGCIGQTVARAQSQTTSVPVPSSSAALPTPTATNTARGFMVCTADLTISARYFYSSPFPATANQSAELAPVYEQMLRDKGHTFDSYAPPNAPRPRLDVDCRWHSTQAEADQFKTGVVARAERMYRRTMPVEFDR